MDFSDLRFPSTIGVGNGFFPTAERGGGWVRVKLSFLFYSLQFILLFFKNVFNALFIVFLNRILNFLMDSKYTK